MPLLLQFPIALLQFPIAPTLLNCFGFIYETFTLTLGRGEVGAYKVQAYPKV